MDEFRRHRDQVRELTDRLIVEYRDDVPAGRVLATVARVHRRVTMNSAPWSEQRLWLCETLARQHLALRR